MAEQKTFYEELNIKDFPKKKVNLEEVRLVIQDVFDLDIRHTLKETYDCNHNVSTATELFEVLNTLQKVSEISE